MSKKILSLALAVVMLVSVFAFTASATTFPADGQVGIRVVSDAYVGMPAGETVTVKAYYVFPDSIDLDSYMHSAGNVVICFNDSYFEFDEGSRVFGDSYVDFFKDTSSAKITDGYFASKVSGKLTANDTAKGYSQCVLVQQTWNTGNGYSASTGFPVDPYGEIFSITFTTLDTLDENANIGIAEGTVGSTTIFKWRNTETKKTVTYAASDVIMDEFTDGAATLNVSDASAFLLRNNADDANTLDVGVMATFMDAAFPVTFAGAVCNELDNVGIEARINGEVKTGLESAELNYIYRNATDDGYDFVGAITGVNDLDAKIEIRAYFIADGTTYYSNWVAVCANLRYDDAVSNGMSAIA